MMSRFVLPATLVALAGVIVLAVLGVRRKNWLFFAGAAALLLVLFLGWLLLLRFITAM